MIFSNLNYTTFLFSFNNEKNATSIYINYKIYYLNIFIKKGMSTSAKTSISMNTDIEMLIKAEVFKKQIRIKDFFVDFDRLRRGVVTEDKVFFKIFLKI